MKQYSFYYKPTPIQGVAEVGRIDDPSIANKLIPSSSYWPHIRSESFNQANYPSLFNKRIALLKYKVELEACWLNPHMAQGTKNYHTDGIGGIYSKALLLCIGANSAKSGTLIRDYNYRNTFFQLKPWHMYWITSDPEHRAVVVKEPRVMFRFFCVPNNG